MFNLARPVAARFHHRRRAQLIFPWGLLTCALLVFMYTGWTGSLSLPGYVWLVIVCASSLVYEMSEPHSRLVHYAYRALNRMFAGRYTRLALDALDEVYSNYPETWFFNNRHRLRWLMPFLITLSTWTWMLLNPRSLSLIVLLTLYSITSFGILALEAMRNVAWGTQVYSWVVLIALGSASIAVAVYGVTRTVSSLLVYGLIAGFIYFGIYTNQRLWIGERVINDLIRQITNQVFAYPDVPRALEKEIPELIGSLLRYERVATLLLGAEPSCLTVTGVFGDLSPSLVGQNIQCDRGGITWRAVERKTPVAWNDVQQCPYYLSLFDDKEQDDTRAEIAVPIIYREKVYGVLDVQSTRPGIYGPGDKLILETIAWIIGSAIALYRDKQLLSQAGTLWDELAVSLSSSEGDLFDIFAHFASQELRVDKVVYYPLSPTGYPHTKPLSFGLDAPQYLHEGITSYSGPLAQLLQKWEYHPSPDTLADPIYFDRSTNQPSPFALREKVKSSYFVPVGVRREPLGALFLNFTKPTQFDHLLDLMVHSFSQAFATVAWKNRYRKLVYESFGSPAYDVHNKRGAYGLKGEVSQEFENQMLKFEGKIIDRSNLDALRDLTERIDRFLDEIQFEEMLVPPNFWDQDISLQRKLEDFIHSRPLLEKDRDPHITISAFDYRIERENPVVKLALYRVISEAVNNAIVHGQANNTSVRIQRQPTSIEIEVRNDGKPLDDDYRKHYTPASKGILYLFKQVRETFGADPTILPIEGDGGVVVRISIPCLLSD
jgi:GAF domain-containing protein